MSAMSQGYQPRAEGGGCGKPGSHRPALDRIHKTMQHALRFNKCQSSQSCSPPSSSPIDLLLRAAATLAGGVGGLLSQRSTGGLKPKGTSRPRLVPPTPAPTIRVRIRTHTHTAPHRCVQAMLPLTFSKSVPTLCLPGASMQLLLHSIFPV